jgi:spore cortex formation protein SpoVR/YcgB (stage V sporulation)
MTERTPLSTTSEWTFELVERYEKAIAEIAAEYDLDTYPNQIEIISSEQMMDAYASSGMPLYYHHWSFGKHFLGIQNRYTRGHMGLAYEIVINSNPCIAYLMEENTMMMQALVIAHASYGHNSFFKGNYLFRTWTDASSIIDYLLFARNYIEHCEQKYGLQTVEQTLDACHALMNYGVDRYKRPYPISASEEVERQKERETYLQQQVNDLWRTIPVDKTELETAEKQRFLAEPQENLLYFIEKKAPLLEPWQREIVRIVRKISQYFYPQRQTQVMNEGWATFWHYTILNTLYDRGLVTDGFMVEFLQSHSSVIAQPAFDSRYYSGINPYALGFAMFRDIRRICENPTDEDRRWFPDFAGSDWRKTLDFAMRSFKDESFIQQFLSPAVIRDFKLFAIVDDDEEKDIRVEAIHDDQGYRRVRELLAAQYNLGDREPNIQIVDIAMRGNRAMYLQHIQHNRRPLNKDTLEVLRHLHHLWGFDIKLDSMQDDHIAESFHYPPKGNEELKISSSS